MLRQGSVMKKFALILAALTAVNLIACGSAGDEAETTDTGAQTDSSSETTAEAGDGLPDVNMEGFTLNVLHHDTSWLTWAKTQLDAEEENGELINDEIYRRNVYIEDRFNCTLNFEGVTQTQELLPQIVASGSDEYDIIFMYGLRVLGNTDYLADFNQIPYMSLDESYWNPDATEVFRVGDKQLAVAGNWTLSYLSGASTFLFNKEIYDNLNTGEDLYEIVDNGEWTIDKFYEVARLGVADLNGDSAIDGSDRIGMTGSAKAYWNSLVIGAGFHYVDFDSDHMPYFIMYGNEQMINFFQKIVETESTDPYIYPVTTDMLNASDKSNAKQTNDFKSGQALFTQMPINNIERDMRDMEQDFGILPPPKYDEAQEKYYSYANIGEIACLPRSYDSSRAENIGILLEAMSYYSQQNIVPAYIDTIIDVKLTRDEESARMLDYIFDGIVFDYGTVVWESDITGQLISNYLLPRSTTLVSTVEQINNNLTAKFEDLFEAVENMP